MKTIYAVSAVIGMLLLILGGKLFTDNMYLNTAQLVLGMGLLVFGVYGIIKLVKAKDSGDKNNDESSQGK